MRRVIAMVLIGTALGAASISPAAPPNEDPLDMELIRVAASQGGDALRVLDVAAREMQGALPVEMELVRHSRKMAHSFECVNAYVVTFLTDGGYRKLTTAINGPVVVREDKPVEPEKQADHKRLRELLNKAPKTLAQAIEAAQREAGGMVVHAEAELADGELEYELEVLPKEQAAGKTELVELEFTGELKIKKTERESAAGRAWVFDLDAVDRAPPATRAAFTHVEGGKADWKVTADAAAPSPCQVLRLSAASAEQVFNVLMFTETSYADLDLAVKLRADSGKEDQGGGLIWRCTDADNYYICRFNPLEKNFRVYKVVDGKRQQLASASTEAKAEAWHTVRTTMVGEKITCWLDDKKLLEASDATFQHAGMIGLWTKADASSSFDDLVVQSPKTPNRGAASGPGGPMEK